METRTSEGVQTWDIGDIRLGGEAQSEDEPATAELCVRTIRPNALNRPLVSGLIELRPCHRGVVLDVSVQLPLFQHVRDIPPELFVSGQQLAPGPVLAELRIGILVNGVSTVDSSPWITVPIPDATGLGGFFDAEDIQPGISKSVHVSMRF
jgi:hypothetical protein